MIFKRAGAAGSFVYTQFVFEITYIFHQQSKFTYTDDESINNGGK